MKYIFPELKEQVHPQMKIPPSSTHPRANGNFELFCSQPNITEA